MGNLICAVSQSIAAGDLRIIKEVRAIDWEKPRDYFRRSW